MNVRVYVVVAYIFVYVGDCRCDIDTMWPPPLGGMWEERDDRPAIPIPPSPLMDNKFKITSTPNP